MRALLHKITSFLILLMLFFSTAGVSLYLHRCTSAGEKDFAVFPELFGTHSGCCSFDLNQTSPCCSNHGPVHESLRREGCCTVSLFYGRLSTNYLPQEVSRQAIPPVEQETLPGENFHKETHREPLSINIPTFFRPPPETCRHLLHLIGQLRISPDPLPA